VGEAAMSLGAPVTHMVKIGHDCIMFKLAYPSRLTCTLVPIVLMSLFGTSPPWSEAAWQTYVNSLLSTEYSLRGRSYQRVADLKGDGGLEGFSCSGDAYQSYADQKSKNNKERTRKQKKKITTDLQKLWTKRKFWTSILQGKQLHTWTLMVPDYDDKDVLEWARIKAEELRLKNLPFIGSTFEGFVKTAEDFPRAKGSLNDPRLPPKSSPPDPSPQEVAGFRDRETTFVKNIDAKIAKVLPHDPVSEREKWRDELLGWHLKCSNYLEGLRQKFPEFWESMQSLINTTANSVRTGQRLDPSPAPARLETTRTNFVATVEATVDFTTPDIRETVSWGTVTKWLGECPLDFVERPNA
jgi:hypothetical protein